MTEFELLLKKQRELAMLRDVYENGPTPTLENMMPSTPDYSNFGIIANTPGPTPDAMLIDEMIKKNNW